MSELVTRTNIMLTGTALSLVLTGCGSGASETESTANRIDTTSSPTAAATAQPRPETTNIFAGKVCDSLSHRLLLGQTDSQVSARNSKRQAVLTYSNDIKMPAAIPDVWHLSRRLRSAVYRLGRPKLPHRLQLTQSVLVLSGIRSNGLNSLRVTMLRLIPFGTYKIIVSPLIT